MASYFISPSTATTWQLDTRRFVELLQQQWPAVRIEHRPDPASNQLLEWSLQTTAGQLDGAVTRNAQVIFVDGAIEACASFALWYRQYIPLEQALRFYDEGFSADVVLRQETTLDDLITAFRA